VLVHSTEPFTVTEFVGPGLLVPDHQRIDPTRTPQDTMTMAVPATRDVDRSTGPISSALSIAPPPVHTNGPNPYRLGTSALDRMMIIWNLGKAKIDRLLRNAPPTTLNARESDPRFPYDIMEMIMAHLDHSHDALKACSLTCYSWYTAAVPHLHHTLILRDRSDKSRAKLKPLSKLHELGLTSVVREIRVVECRKFWFIPQAFSSSDLRHFSAFVNVQDLTLDWINIPHFIPGIERYFGHLAPVLRSIVLHYPYCTPRQLSHFLSLFSNLENVYIHSPGHSSNASVPDTELVPFSPPRFGGRLKLFNFRWVETWTDLITSCGGLRFRHMDLHLVRDCVPVLLEACVETLKTLRFHVTDALFCGE